MSRLTDEELAEFCALVDAAREEGDPDGEAGMTLDDFLDSHVKQIADELRSARGQGALSEADREALEFSRGDIENALNPLMDDGCECERCGKRRRALAILDRLIAGVPK